LFFGSCISPLSASFTSLKALDPTLVSQLKETLPAALFEKLNGSLSIDQDRLKFAEYKNRVLEERLRLVRIDKYGPGSEKLSDAQLELLELEPGVSSAEVRQIGFQSSTLSASGLDFTGCNFPEKNEKAALHFCASSARRLLLC